MREYTSWIWSASETPSLWMRSVMSWGFASRGMNAGAPPCGSGSVLADIVKVGGRSLRVCRFFDDGALDTL